MAALNSSRGGGERQHALHFISSFRVFQYASHFSGLGAYAVMIYGLYHGTPACCNREFWLSLAQKDRPHVFPGNPPSPEGKATFGTGANSSINQNLHIVSPEIHLFQYAGSFSAVSEGSRESLSDYCKQIGKPSGIKYFHDRLIDIVKNKLISRK